MQYVEGLASLVVVLGGLAVVMLVVGWLLGVDSWNGG
jgi:hypothetical protein